MRTSGMTLCFLYTAICALKLVTVGAWQIARTLTVPSVAVVPFGVYR